MSMASSVTVQSMLERLGMEQYVRPLLERGYDTPAKCKHLTDDLLIRAGVNKANQRRRILSTMQDPHSSGSFMDTSGDDDGVYGNAVVAAMHEERRASQASCVTEDLPPPPPCGGVKRESVKGYIPMTKNRDSTSSSNSNSPRVSNVTQEDIYDCPPPARSRYSEVGTSEELPPMLPPKRNPSRRDKAGLPPTRASSHSSSPVPQVTRQDSDATKRPPVPKPRTSIRQTKPVPAPRTKKNSIKIKGVTEESSDDFDVSTTEIEEDDVYQEMSDVSLHTSWADNGSRQDMSSLPATSSSLDSLDVSGVMSINWGGGGGGGGGGDSDSVVKQRSQSLDELDIGVPPPKTPLVPTMDDEYVMPDLGERPPSGGCDGQHSPPPQKTPQEKPYSRDRKTEQDDTDDNIMVDNSVYASSSIHPQPEGRVVIGAELSAEEVENMANESAERVPIRPGAYGGSSSSGGGQDTSLGIASPDDPCYGTIWDMKSGRQSAKATDTNDDNTAPASLSRSSSTDSLSLLGDAPSPPAFPAPKPPLAPRAKPGKPTLDSAIPIQTVKRPGIQAETPGSRDSTLSFNEPPPSFSPPPLPFDTPPFLPPRPCQSKGSVFGKSPVLSPSPSPLQKSHSLDFPLFDEPATSAPKPPLPLLNTGDYITSGPSTAAAAASNSASDLYSVSTKSLSPQVPPPKPLRLPNPASDENSSFEKSPTPTFETRPGFGSFPGGSDEDPFGLSSSVGSSKGPPPVPPPKTKSLEDMYDEKARGGTYYLQDQWQDEEKPEGSFAATVWESDDTLSDGGDFFDEGAIKPDKNTLKSKQLPIIAARKSSITEKKGYLYKQCSSRGERIPSQLIHGFKLGSSNPARKNSKRTGWQKRWVTFDSEQFKYYSNNKSVVSKRIIPVSTILDVEQEIKQGEGHPHRFILRTVDRIYCFATEDSTELTVWANVIMQAVIHYNANTEEHPEGGDMCNPALKGYVKMEGAAGKRFLAVKGSRMCYYNTYTDYIAGSPIHEIDMKLANVKDCGKLKFQLTTPYAPYVLHFETDTDLSQWKDALEEAIADGLSDDSVMEMVYEIAANRLCADCGAPNPHWASINLAITICKHCAGIHRQISIPLSKVKSLRMDFKVWTPCSINLMKEIGNDNANKFWEWNSSEEDRIDSDADMPAREVYIKAKYREAAYCRLHPLAPDQEALNEALCKAVQYEDVLETLQLFFSGAQIHYTSKMLGIKGMTPLQLARSAHQKLQEEFLRQNGADSSPPPAPHSPSWHASSPAANASLVPNTTISFICQKGYLYKTGSDTKSNFLKRWVELENGRLNYYETDKSPSPKDTIECKDMLSITKTSDERFPFAFEIASIRQNNRVYLFACETSEQARDEWVTSLCHAVCDLDGTQLHYVMPPITKGGCVHLRVGATDRYRKGWIHLRGHTLHIQNKEKDAFLQVDLRMLKSITMLQSTESCVNALEKDGHPFVIDMVDSAYYIQSDLKKETTNWYQAIQGATKGRCSSVAEQQLTADNVPVLVEKCIDFITLHALDEEGIYRHNGQHSRVSQLLDSFYQDARSVHLVRGETQIHDVTNALKRFFRSLEDPLLRTCLYPRWLDFAAMKYSNMKVRWTKQLLEELPPVNYATLKAMIRHLAMVAEHSDQNKMIIANLSAIFGPVFMTVDKAETSGGFSNTSNEIAVVSDLIEHCHELFEIQDKEKKVAENTMAAMKRIKDLEGRNTVIDMDEMLVGIHVDSKYSDSINVKVSRTTTVAQLMQDQKVKERLVHTKNHGLYEVICQEDLERPLHYSEKVLDVVIRWGSWPEEDRKDCYLCFKDNYVYSCIQEVFDPTTSLFGEMKFSEKKGFKKFCFEFTQLKLSYQRDPKSNQIGSWNVEDITVYIGSQQKKAAPTPHLLTFIKNGETVVKSRDTPYFGHTICCNSKEDLYRWLAAMIYGQHPEGLSMDEKRDGSMLGASQNLDTFVPTSPNPRQSPHAHHSTKQSMWSKLKNFNK